MHIPSIVEFNFFLCNITAKKYEQILMSNYYSINCKTFGGIVTRKRFSNGKLPFRNRVEQKTKIRKETCRNIEKKTLANSQQSNLNTKNEISKMSRKMTNKQKMYTFPSGFEHALESILLFVIFPFIDKTLWL